MRFKVFYLADTALLNHLLNAEKIAVPAAVMEDREQALFFLRKRNQISRFLHIQRKWLIHHYVLAGVERGVASGAWVALGEAITTVSISGC